MTATLAIVGAPGSGKTTIGEQFKAEGFAVVDENNFRRKIGDEWELDEAKFREAAVGADIILMSCPVITNLAKRYVRIEISDAELTKRIGGRPSGYGKTPEELEKALLCNSEIAKLSYPVYTIGEQTLVQKE
jgi:GTPase SAR1 family protein